MKVSQIKSDRQFQSMRWANYGISTYGETNDFPQVVDEIITASKTGNACLDIYEDFVYGMGFVEKGIASLVVNRKGQTLSKLMRFIADDFTKFGGFAMHVNYNLNYRIRSIAHVPFENIRLGLPDDNGIIHKLVLHPDWGYRDKTRRIWSTKDIEHFNVFNPDPDIIEEQVKTAGCWEDYKGQIFYFSGISEGELVYPVPKYIAEMTDMRTEEGLANVTGRNVCSNFLLAGILVDILSEEQTQEQLDEKQAALEKFQGDGNASQLWYMTAKNKEEVPAFVPFTGENYDKAFSQTQAIIPDNIGQAFKQPPILRAKDVGANFGADLMTNAYKFYNSVTSRERGQIQEAFELLFSHWWAQLDNPNFAIQPLVYNAGASLYERLGKEAMVMVINIVNNRKDTAIQRRNKLKFLFGISDDECTKLLVDDTNA